MNKPIFKRLFCDNEWWNFQNVKNYQSVQRVITRTSYRCNYNLWEFQPFPSTKYSVIKIIHAIILTEKSAAQLPQKVHKIVQQFNDR
jgi:hypothetical protein